jgi:hypothetical protein
MELKGRISLDILLKYLQKQIKAEKIQIKLQ